MPSHSLNPGGRSCKQFEEIVNESISSFLHLNSLGCASKRAASRLRKVILPFSLAFMNLHLDTVSSLGSPMQEKH